MFSRYFFSGIARHYKFMGLAGRCFSQSLPDARELILQGDELLFAQNDAGFFVTKSYTSDIYDIFSKASDYQPRKLSR